MEIISRPDELQKLRWRFPELLGIELVSEGAGEACMRLRQSDNVSNAVGTVHGGALAALLDVAVTQAARCCGQHVAAVLTISLSITFVAPAKGELTVHAKTLTAGRTIASVGADIYRADGGLVASALATLRLQVRSQAE